MKLYWFRYLCKKSRESINLRTFNRIRYLISLMYKIVLDSIGAHVLKVFESWEWVKPSVYGTSRKTLRMLLRLQICTVHLNRELILYRKSVLKSGQPGWLQPRSRSRYVQLSVLWSVVILETFWYRFTVRKFFPTKRGVQKDPYAQKYWNAYQCVPCAFYGRVVRNTQARRRLRYCK